MLQLTVRQVRRLQRAYAVQGAAALASKRRGRPSNRKLAADVRARVLALVKERYADFGPTLACEKLREQHDVVVSVETLRTWMSSEGLWRTRMQRRKPAQSPRRRRSCLGELVQIDGSDHEWFEGRAPRCTPLGLRRRRDESFDGAALRALRIDVRVLRGDRALCACARKALRFLQRQGRRLSRQCQGCTRGRRLHAIWTRYVRAEYRRDLRQHARGQGRVERAHQTLQDRLVKELRLRGISGRDAGNAYLGEFMKDYNQRFACEPQSPHDAHRTLLPQENLARIFSWQEERRLTGSLTLHYNRVMYVVASTPASEKARGKRVTVREEEDGTVHIEYRGEHLDAYAFPKDARVHQGAIVENKLLGHVLSVIAQGQRERDKRTLQTKRLTLRDEDLMRKAMGEPGLTTRRPRANQKRQQSARSIAPLPVTHPLATALQSAKPHPKPATLDRGTQADNCTLQSTGHF
ncbi:MAG: helix-turn-helix domain-containing protein [Sandaracinaceae bacterium]|nr:helix-turn-helix domain-containing protein [Sandaracinaceae bacterium]